jgi:hypothetical protein
MSRPEIFKNFIDTREKMEYQPFLFWDIKIRKSLPIALTADK